MTTLEQRYRWLLSWYPAAWRREYTEEMLGVLMDGTRPGQRRPGFVETVDLVRSALWQRLGRAGGGLADSRWADAASVLGLLVPVLLLVRLARDVLVAYLWHLRIDAPWPPAGWVSFALVAWIVAGVTGLFGWRAVAAVVAWAAVLGEAVRLGLRYPDAPVTVLYGLWPLLFGATAAAGLTVRGSARRGLAVFGRRRCAVFAGVVAPAGLSWAIDPLTANVGWGGGGGDEPQTIGHPGLMAPGWVGVLPGIVRPLAAVTVLVLLLRTAPPVRARLLALLAPTAALVVLISVAYNGFTMSSVRFDPPVLLVPGEWVGLAVTPLIVFGVAVGLVRWTDRRRYLIELGEAAERDQR
jgi:hypothetical protein